jgi:hypothetical protein
MFIDLEWYGDAEDSEDDDDRDDVGEVFHDRDECDRPVAGLLEY